MSIQTRLLKNNAFGLISLGTLLFLIIFSVLSFLFSIRLAFYSGFEQLSESHQKELTVFLLPYLDNMNAHLDDVKYLASIGSSHICLNSRVNISDRAEVELEFVELARVKSFFQVRFLDSAGIESVRINFPRGSIEPFVEIEANLQNKSGRYYSQAYFEGEMADGWISLLDLNRENGEVELPIIPTLRYGIEIPCGFMIANQDVGHVLDSLNQYIPTGITALFFDEEGNYFVNSEFPEKEWERDVGETLSFAEDWGEGTLAELFSNDIPDEGVIEASKGNRYFSYRRFSHSGKTKVAGIVFPSGKGKLFLPIFVPDPPAAYLQGKTYIFVGIIAITVLDPLLFFLVRFAVRLLVSQKLFKKTVSKLKTVEKEKHHLEIKIAELENNKRQKQGGVNVAASKIFRILDQLIQNAPSRQEKEDLQYIIQAVEDNAIYRVDVNNLHDKEMANWLQSNFVQTQDTQFTLSTSPTSAHSPAQFPSQTSLSMMAIQIHPDDVEVGEFDSDLARSPEWDFDVFALSKKSDGHALFVLAMRLFSHHELLEPTLPVSVPAFTKFLRAVEKGYSTSHPYHNRIHAADVLQACNTLLNQSGLIRRLSSLEIFSLFIAALLHDYQVIPILPNFLFDLFKHPGKNNNFHQATKSKLAMRYNDKSILENHHASAGLMIASAPDINLFGQFSESDQLSIRKFIISAILATDMSRHFEILAQFQQKISTKVFLMVLPNHPENVILLEIILKMADVSNPARPRLLCTEWADRVCEEFFLQGDTEAQMGLPVSQFMDRHTTVKPTVQTGFIEFVVIPLFKAFDEQFPISDCLGQLGKNVDYWKSLQ